MKIITSLLAVLALSVLTVKAEDAPKTDAPKTEAPKGEKPKLTPEEIFKKKDVNGDGKLTKEEFIGKSKDAAKMGERFDAIDKDKTGSITLEQFKAAMAKHGKGKKKEEAK